MGILTDETRSMVGVTSTPRTANQPLDLERLRLFVHGAMEHLPVHCDPEAARASRYGELVAPPLFPIHAFRRGIDEPDPFDALSDDPELDGTFMPNGFGSLFGLPPIDLPLKRVLLGGTDGRFHQLARLGDVITSQSRYADIFEREGQDGPLVFVKIMTRYTNQRDELLAIITTNLIHR